MKHLNLVSINNSNDFLKTLTRGSRLFYLAEHYLSSGQVRLLDVYAQGGRPVNADLAALLALPLKDGLLQVDRLPDASEGEELVADAAHELFGDEQALVGVPLTVQDYSYAPAVERVSRSFSGRVLDLQTLSYARTGYTARTILLWDGSSDCVHRHRLPRGCPTPAMGSQVAVHYGSKGRAFVEIDRAQA